MTIKLLAVGPLLTNCYFVISKDEFLIIDPGGEPEKILEEIRSQKAKLKYIINTHGHSDHTFGNEKIRKETNVKILIHEAEKDFIKLAPYRPAPLERGGAVRGSKQISF